MAVFTSFNILANYFKPLNGGVIATLTLCSSVEFKETKINNYLTKENKLIFVIGLSLMAAVFIISWANHESPIYRPLIQDMRLVDSIKISDVLDQNHINYYADIKSHMLYVSQAESELARISLAKIGIVIDYPELNNHADLNKAYDELLKTIEAEQLNAPILKQPWFIEFQKLAMAFLLIIVLFLTVLRPAVQEIILGQDEK